MMPLSILKAGEEGQIKKINGRGESVSFLKNLGFVEGEKVKVVSELNGNLIIHIKDSRIALDRTLANKIIV